MRNRFVTMKIILISCQSCQFHNGVLLNRCFTEICIVMLRVLEAFPTEYVGVGLFRSAITIHTDEFRKKEYSYSFLLCICCVKGGKGV